MHAHLELPASNVISVRHLAGLGGRTDGVCACREFSRLPPHGLLPRRSCPHLVLISYELFIWYDDSLIEMTGTKHRGLAPHKITPMLGVHGPKSRVVVWPSQCGPSRLGHRYRSSAQPTQ